MQQLLNIMRELREKCPWDREQTPLSLTPYAIEEAYEVEAAVREGHLDEIRDELGDLLLQVVFQAQMYSEQGAFDFQDVVDAICEKLINLMDGDIEVNSQIGLGSSFTIRIPLYGQEYIKKNIPEYRAHYRIAISCRNEFLMNFLLRLLSHEQFTVVGHHSIDKTQNYDLLITDYEYTGGITCEDHIQLSSFYAGELHEIKSHQWIYNTYQLDKLPVLIDKVIMKTIEQSQKNNIANQPLVADNSLGECHVLIVDDHPINRALLSEQLASIGFTTGTAIDGLDALKYLNNHHVDIVLTDVNMPNMDGYQLAKELRRLEFSLPVIALTANAMAEEKQRCINAGMNDCLSKPTTIAILRETLTRYC